MSTLSTGTLVLFALAALIAFLVPFIREAAYKQLTWLPEWQAVKRFAAVLLPFLLLALLAQYFKIAAGDALRYLAAGALVPFFLARLSLPARLNGIILLAMTVALTCLVKDATAVPACFALICGAAVWKVSENLLIGAVSSVEDILPALIWLVGVNWVRTALPEAQWLSHDGILLATLSVVLIIRTVQNRFVCLDKLFVKRILLAVAGGAGVLLVMNKLLLLPLQNSLCPLAALIGAGILVSYLLEGLKSTEAPSGQSQLTSAVSILVLVGILTLVSTRLFGNFGLLAVAPTMLLGSAESFAHPAALFLVARGLLQGYTLTYVQNVTGVNLTHPYTTAALFAGFLLSGLAVATLRDISQRRWCVTIILAAGGLTPLLSNFFLHEEPTGSLLISTTTAAVMLAALGPALCRTNVSQQSNLLLLPLLMTAFALWSHELIELGNAGTGVDKIVILLYCATAVIVFSGLLYWLFSRLARQQVEVAGD